jgi:succinylarginine dihydrolase
VIPAHEINFDGLVGPTHNYAGLSYGNVASLANRATPSRPREAALQGLAKMKALAELGLPQAVLPPHERPDVGALRALGFAGDDRAVLARARREAPELLAACSSASAMWTANACTVAPSADTADGRVHFTPANLVSKLHRSLEAATTTRVLRALFRDPAHFVVHEPLPGGAALGDEGAANHTRFCTAHGNRGLHCFVYGVRALEPDSPRPARFPARQSFEACAAIARRHQLAPQRTVFLQQHPAAIDAGAFHNDVVAVGHRHLHFHHELAFLGGREATETLALAARETLGRDLVDLEVPTAAVSLADTIRSYLFNSQLVTLPGAAGSEAFALIAPAECQRTPAVAAYLERLVADPFSPIRQVHYCDLRQSMRNGGGPACLRQRVVLTATERARLPAGVFIDAASVARLEAWVHRHYREELHFDDLADPALLEESRRALDELTALLGLGSVYPFQLCGA